jgi:hypothetical protein
MNVVPRVLGIAEATVRDLQFLVLVWRRNYTTMEKVILTLQLRKLVWDGDVALVISYHSQALLDDSPGGGVLQVEWVLSILGQSCLRGRAEPQGRIRPQGAADIGKSVIGITTVSTRRLPHKEVRVTCAVCLTVSSTSVSMAVALHGSTGLRGMVTLTSHWSRPWAIDMLAR